MTASVESTITRNREGRYCIAIDGKWTVLDFGRGVFLTFVQGK